MQHLHEDLRDLDQRFTVLLNVHVGKPISIPDLQPASFRKVYPRPKEVSLSPYTLAAYTDFLSLGRSGVKIFRNQAMQKFRSSHLETTSSLRRAVAGPFMETLAESSKLQELYLAGVELKSLRDLPLYPVHSMNPLPLLQEADGTVALPEGGGEFSSDGKTKLLVATGGWDPEQRSVLRCRLEQLAGVRPARIEVWFSSDLPIALQPCWFDLPDQEPRELKIDLLQAVPYALSGQIHELHLQFIAPGRYRISGLSFGEK